MACVIIIGTQWGDEGKGKIVDLLAQDAQAIVRFQGGNNAGHTLVVDGQKYILHLLPSGVLYDGKTCYIGNGVVLDPQVLLGELEALAKRGFAAGPDKIRVSDRAHLIMPYHKALDLAREAAKGKAAIGTTGRGIGPCYEDKSARVGVRVCDLLEPELMGAKIREQVREKNFWLEKYFGAETLDAETIIADYQEYAKRLEPFITDVSVELDRLVSQGGRLLFEGAQGTHLDIDHGTYPYVTSSNPVAGSACTGSGVGVTKLNSVWGVVKAYTTRVGGGPFPSELTDETGKFLQDQGGEFGSTTGRPRRCGWFDAVVVRTAVRLSGITGLAVTKLDVLTGLKTLKLCTGYQLPDGGTLDHMPASLAQLERCQPIYEEMPGWEEDITGARSLEELPATCQAYLARLAELSGAPLALVSVGPARDATIILSEAYAA